MSFRTLDLNLLRVFDALMAEGSLTKAAEALAITQPAASHALRRLHDALGETLFQRGAKGMQPTARATSLWPQVRAALSSLEQALAPSRFDPRVDRVQFRMAMPDASAAVMAPAMVEALESVGAVCDLRFLPLTTRDPRQILLDGKVDLAVGHFPGVMRLISAEADPPPFKETVLHRSGYVCVMRQGHPLAAAPLTLERFCEAHHLLLSLSGRSRGMVDEVLGAMGRTRRIVLTVNQYQTAGRVLGQSDLVTVLPASLMGAVGQRDRLITRPVPLELPPLAVEMMWLARREQEPPLRWLRELVQRSARFGAADEIAAPPALGQGA